MAATEALNQNVHPRSGILVKSTGKWNQCDWNFSDGRLWFRLYLLLQYLSRQSIVILNRRVFCKDRNRPGAEYIRLSD